MRKLLAAAGLVVAALLGAGVGCANVALTAHAATVAEDVAPEGTSDGACWFEKAESLDTAELICGARGLRPAGSVEVYQLADGEVPEVVWKYASAHGAPSWAEDGCECLYVPVGTVLGPVGEEWVATVDGMEPVPSV